MSKKKVSQSALKQALEVAQSLGDANQVKALEAMIKKGQEQGLVTTGTARSSCDAKAKLDDLFEKHFLTRDDVKAQLEELRKESGTESHTYKRVVKGKEETSLVKDARWHYTTVKMYPLKSWDSTNPFK